MTHAHRIAVRLHVCGIPQKEIAAAIGVAPSTICRWLRRARVDGTYERVALQSGEWGKRGKFYGYM